MSFQTQEVQDLHLELERTQEELKSAKADARNAEALLKRLREENEGLRKVRDFYADEDNWFSVEDYDGCCVPGKIHESDIEYDEKYNGSGGKMAREAQRKEKQDG